MKKSLMILAAIGLMLAATDVTAGPIGYAVQSDGNDHLYTIDLTTGATTDLGLVGLADTQGAAFVGSALYGIGGTVDEFWNITSPPGFKVGNTLARARIDAGLAYDATSGKMYNIQRDLLGYDLYEINMSTGAASWIGGASGPEPDGMAISSGGVAYAIDMLGRDSLYTVDLTTGALTLVGGLGFNFSAESGLSFDPVTGILYAITDGGKIYTVNTSTGAATFVANTLTGFESLAVIPEPATMSLLALSACLPLLRKRR